MSLDRTPPVPDDWSGRFETFLDRPGDVLPSDSFPAPGPLRDRVQCGILEPPAGALDADGGAGWEKLARAALSGSEMTHWRALGGPKRRSEWLLGRVAAKDVVRRHLFDTRGLRLAPADVVIGADASGRPTLDRGSEPLRDLSLAISLSHTDGIAMALVTEPEAGVGIDVERLSRRRGDYAEAAFTPSEMGRLDSGGAAAGRPERGLRLWCAKEAVAKALGRGLMGNPMNLETQAVDAGWTRIDLAVAGSLARALPNRVGRPVSAHISVAGDLVVAAALVEPPG